MFKRLNKDYIDYMNKKNNKKLNPYVVEERKRIKKLSDTKLLKEFEDITYHITYLGTGREEELLQDLLLTEMSNRSKKLLRKAEEIDNRIKLEKRLEEFNVGAWKYYKAKIFTLQWIYFYILY